MARKDIAGIVSGSGLVTAIMTNIRAAAAKVNPPQEFDEFVHFLGRPEAVDYLICCRELHRRIKAGEFTLEHALEKMQLSVNGKATEAVLTARVNYGSPRWGTLEGSYTYVDSDLKPEHFPLQGKGQATVLYEYLTYDHEPTTQEVLDDIDRRGDVRRPDRAETESFLAAHPEEKDKYPVIGLCGTIVDLRGYRCVACVNASGSRRFLHFLRLDFRLNQNCRFLVVRK